MIAHPIYVVATAATIPVPPFTDGAYVAGWHLIGIGLFIAERGPEGRWRFARRAQAIPAGEPESTLLQWSMARLPEEATLIGWNVDHALVPALLDAAATASPVVAHSFTGRLHRVLRVGVVDVALQYGGAGAAPLSTIAADVAVYAPKRNMDALVGTWALGAVDQIRRDLADEALAIWRAFIRGAGSAGLDAEDATNAWMLRRQQMNAVAPSGSAA